MTQNPFNPNFGNIPSLFIDREHLVQEVADGIRELSASPYQTTLIYGIRGAGKTVFLNDVCRNIRQDKKWVVVYLASTENLLADLIQSVIRKTRSVLGKALDTVSVGLSVPGVNVSLSSGGAADTVSYKNALEEILETFRKKKMSLLIAIDEVESSESVRRLASIYNVLKNQDYPVAMIMTGLPKNISELQNDHVLTFLLRSARVELQPLDLITVKYCYKDTFAKAGLKTEEAVLTRMTLMTQGYAYAFQLLGYLIWNAGRRVIDEAVLDAITDPYKLSLFRNVYSKIYSDLTSVEKNFVGVMARSPENMVSTGNLADGLGKSKGYVSTYRLRLLNDQIIRSESRGTVSFALPFFKDYVLEAEALHIV